MTTNTFKKGKHDRIVSVISRYRPIYLILVFSAFLFTYRLEAEGLWLDELTSIQDADLGVVEVFKENQLRPLYYFLLKGWMYFGDSDAWLRSLSVCFAVISVFLLYKLGRRLAGESEGLIAALLMTVSPMFINHAQEIRMYVLSLCLGVAGTLFLTEALLTEPSQSPSSKNLAGWSLFRLLAIYTVPLNVTLLLPDVVIIALRFRRERAVLLSFGKWLLLLVILWIPALVSVVAEVAPDSTFATHHTNASPPDWSQLIRPLKFATVWPFAVPDNAIIAFFHKGFTVLIMGVVGVSLIRKRTPFTLWWVSAWLVMPLVPIIVFSYISVPIWVNRYLLFVCPYLFILLAAGLTRLLQQWRVAAVAIGAVYIVAVSGGLVHYYTVQDRPDYKLNIQTIEQYEQPGDAIVWSYHYQKALSRYYDGSSKVYWRTIRDVKTPEDIELWLAQFPVGYERLWLVLDNNPKKSEALRKAVASTYNIDETFKFEQGSEVLLLTTD